jgi:ATP-dependent Clp protease ATP-binding subunit ClpA
VFERFTQEARQVVVAAQEEARGLRADEIAPVHLLLAIAGCGGPGGHVLDAAGLTPGRLRSAAAPAGDPLDADALAALGVDLAQVRAAVEAAFGPGALDPPGTSSHIRFAAGSKRSLEESLRHAVRHRDRRIDSGSLLAGVLAVDDPVVSRVLRQLGVDADALRHRTGGTGEVA